MQIVRDVTDLHRLMQNKIAFVPTMGALHEGHAALIRRARELSETVIVSVFVNPLQFEDPVDLEKYPRTPESDVEVAERAGATALWIPEATQIYPGEIPKISAGALGALYEGARRKGHFEGVLTVVKQFFDLLDPTWALFGEKDFQQFFLIRQMVRQQGLGVKIVPVPTVRESNGLAISSRNVRLNNEDREAALVISRALTSASQKSLIGEMQEELDKILDQEPRFTRDYAVIIDENDFELARQATVAKRALIAGWVNGVRLIDNMPMTAGAR